MVLGARRGPAPRRRVETDGNINLVVFRAKSNIYATERIRYRICLLISNLPAASHR